MKIVLHQKRTKMDLQTVMDLFYKSADREDGCSSWKYNPKCPLVKEKEKAYNNTGYFLAGRQAGRLARRQAGMLAG